MEERSVFGEKFTENMKADLPNCGVETIKNIAPIPKLDYLN